MVVKAALTAIDHNVNVLREQVFYKAQSAPLEPS